MLSSPALRKCPRFQSQIGEPARVRLNPPLERPKPPLAQQGRLRRLRQDVKQELRQLQIQPLPGHTPEPSPSSSNKTQRLKHNRAESISWSRS